jgi:transposase
VLLADEGVGTNEIVSRVGVSKPTVIAWKKRYAAAGIAGLQDLAKPGRPAQIDEVAVVLATLEPPPAQLGVTHWSSRLLDEQLGISNVWIATIWRKWGLQPWRRETFKFSTDPQLAAKVRDHRGAPIGTEVVWLCWHGDDESSLDFNGSGAPTSAASTSNTLPLRQASTGLDHPEAAHTGAGRPVDLAGDLRAHQLGLARTLVADHLLPLRAAGSPANLGLFRKP